MLQLSTKGLVAVVGRVKNNITSYVTLSGTLVVLLDAAVPSLLKCFRNSSTLKHTATHIHTANNSTKLTHQLTAVLFHAIEH